MVADDGDENIHQNDAENQDNDPFSEYNIKKIYLDNYDQPVIDNCICHQILRRFRQAIIDGSLMYYVGHGNEFLWTEEIQIIILFIVGVRLPLFVTTTCEFGKYDDPLHNW